MIFKIPCVYLTGISWCLASGLWDIQALKVLWRSTKLKDIGFQYKFDTKMGLATTLDRV